MSTLVELNQHRADAGAAYVAAVAALKAAYINLAGIDTALQNHNVVGTPLLSFSRDRLQLIEAMHYLEHKQYLPTVVANWDDEITASASARIAAFPTAD